jgi:FkbM family methyltransferase
MIESERGRTSNRFGRSFRTWVRDSLLRCGWDVRRTASYVETRSAEWNRRELAKWRLIQSYSPRTVLDIGANTGQFAQLVRQLLPNSRIISFEPLLQCFEQLTMQQAHLAPFVAYPFALGDKDITTHIHHNHFSPSSSLLTMERLHKEEIPNTAHTVAEEIQVRRLDGIAEELQLEDPVFIKLDVQGYTAPVLRGGEHVVRRACALVAEVSVQPLYQGETTFDQAYKILTEWGFVYRGNVDQWCSERDGRILQCDCLFENTNYSKNIER